MDNSLSNAVEKFMQIALTCNESSLDKFWQWQDYDGDGARFIFFRIYEELRTLAAALREQRIAHGPTLTETHLVLGNYHAAYRDLTAALLGITPEDFDRAPAEKEWPLRTVMQHIIEADMSFFVVFINGLKNHRENNSKLEKVTDEFWLETTGTTDPQLEALFKGPHDEILRFYADFHARILGELSQMDDTDLDKIALFWEDSPYPLRFRLHRFNAHVYQHAIQVDKTLVGIGQPPTEVKRLLRMEHAGLADAESALIGADSFGQELIEDCVEKIAFYTDELTNILKE